jgi:(1->4)-alpha-D-glucan 1-alpha-D-glucosylmutase
MKEHWTDGRLKLYVLSRSLRVRRRHAELFDAGRYLPVEVRGRMRDHVVAFARRRRAAWAVAAVARLTSGLLDGDPRWPVGEGAWSSTTLILPDGAPTQWRDAFSGATVSARARSGVHTLSLAAVLAELPVALLEPEA